MVSEVPDEAILKILDFKCKTIRNDLGNQYWGLTAEAYSVLYFRLFLRAVKYDQPLHNVILLPAQHIEFYKTTIARLVKVQELPPTALERFDRTFVTNEQQYA